MANCEYCKLQDNCPGLNECVHWSDDAKRYDWLRSRKGLYLRSDSGIWTRPDGTKFIASHYLAEGNIQHGPAETLDETIDAAMRVPEMYSAVLRGEPLAMNPLENTVTQEG